MSNVSKYKKDARKKALKELLIGLAVAAVGGFVSWASYSSAKPGGSYTVYTGIIVLGIFYAGKGIWDLIFPFGIKGDKAPLAPEDKSAKAKAEAAVEAEVTDEEAPSKD